MSKKFSRQIQDVYGNLNPEENPLYDYYREIYSEYVKDCKKDREKPLRFRHFKRELKAID